MAAQIEALQSRTASHANAVESQLAAESGLAIPHRFHTGAMSRSRRPIEALQARTASHANAFESQLAEMTEALQSRTAAHASASSRSSPR